MLFPIWGISPVVVAGLLLAVASPIAAAEYFVARDGSDANDGRTARTAFATVQKGVDALRPGDILTIRPGDYHESVARTGLGGPEGETILRAEIPGTVLLRGDVDAPPLRRVEGRRFTYVADFRTRRSVSAVNEIDTLSILKRMPSASELEFVPGSFHHDVAAGKLYVSASDLKSAQNHRYSVSVLSTNGLRLVRPERVTLEGIAATGYRATKLLHYSEGTAGGVWGLFLLNARRCTIRDCRAYLNGWGIGLNSEAKGSGDNVVERCESWGNTSPFANGDMGGITCFSARRDAIRNCRVYRNGMYGINIYGTGGAAPAADEGGNTAKNRSRLEDNVAWGNATADIKIKTGYDYFHVAQRCAAPGLWSVTNIARGLMGRGKDATGGSICLSDHAKLDLRQEFADPDNHDYRLQSASRFRGAGPGKADLGPFDYAANVFYLRPDGDDAADGLSIAAAWRTLPRALRGLRAGDTLYLESGEYVAGVEFSPAGRKGAPIRLRGRGKGKVLLAGAFRLQRGGWAEFSRLRFRDGVRAEKADEVTFDCCEFGTLEASGVRGLRVAHCALGGSGDAALSANGCERIDLRGNWFDNVRGVGVRIPDLAAVRHAGRNGYRTPASAWEVGGKVQARDSAEGGPFGKPLGPYRDEPRRYELRLAAGPSVHSVSATTANLEWMTTLPATCRLAWGETPACEKAVTFDANCFGTWSLTGLTPGRRYWFRIRSMEVPAGMVPKIDSTVTPPDGEPISFTTRERNAAPKTYHVATDGDDGRSGLDRKSAWRTLGRAAAKVNVGDRVVVAGGKYAERVRLRATGEFGLPITFCAAPGERVELDGSDMALHTAFVVGGKRRLRFDGFYFANFNMFPNDVWGLMRSGDFLLHDCKGIEIRRCFHDGRGGYSASAVTAYDVEGLTIRDCVNTFKMTGAMFFTRCPDLVVENTVFAAPMIMSFVLRNGKKQKATMTNCVFTDMLEKKAKLNIGLLCVDGELDAFKHRNNCYFLRCFPPETRVLNGDKPAGKLGRYIVDPLFADPLFAGDPGVKGNPKDKSGHGPDRMMDTAVKLDFDSFFTTAPELVRRGIGLRPASFKDYRFASDREAAKQ